MVCCSGNCAEAEDPELVDWPGVKNLNPAKTRAAITTRTNAIRIIVMDGRVAGVNTD
jgi:hypothetical protein